MIYSKRRVIGSTFSFLGEGMNESEILEKRLNLVLRHISNVREDCLLLGERLIEQGEERLGRELIANGLIHDNSKLQGIEWEYMHTDIKEKSPDLFFSAYKNHVTTNKHHPEAHAGGITEMSRLYLAEMCCDWHSRSSEFGTDLWVWVKEEAIPKYKISTSGKTYKEIKGFLDLLLERKFK
jgi:hypothetical protein